MSPITIEIIQKNNGKIISKMERTVDDSGNRMTISTEAYPPNSKEPVKTTITLTRVEKGAPGSHATSGSWRDEKVETPRPTFCFEHTK